MPAHKDLTGSDLHTAAIISATDPGAVGAGKEWWDTSADANNPALWVRKIRNGTDTAWVAAPLASHTQAASTVTPDTAGFDNNLSAADDTVQKALNTLDDKVIIGGSAGTTDNAIPRADGTGSKTLQGSGVTIDDNNQVSGKQFYNACYDNGNSGAGTVTINWQNGVFQKLILTGNPTIAFSNIPSGVKLILMLIQDGTGSHTVTWPTTHLAWHGGSAPTLQTVAANRNIIGFISDGTDVWATPYGAFGVAPT